MALSVGTRLGSYEIQSAIGAGGMGEVYRARDTRLGRDVAIKILAPVFTSDPDRLARFGREARLLAALNHPNIGAIYGLEETDGALALVLELVEGEALNDRLTRGPLPLKDALRVAAQIAEGLDAAHEKGIVHRDLKPANIKITPDGVVKVLDFGLAKAAEDLTRHDAVDSPTITAVNTREGVVLGTAAYMSPEQARGQALDKRTDIWAFGCVLYEMLTGRSAFGRDTTTDTLAAVVDREPDWSALPTLAPPALVTLLRHCLEKESRRRLRDIADARLDLGDSTSIRRDADLTTRTVRGAREVQFQRLTDFVGMKEAPAISPDGKMVAFVAVVKGRRQIWILLLAGGAPLQVTHDDADHRQPRWAPDSSTLIYFVAAPVHGSEGTIWEISALGGAPRRVASAIMGGDVSREGRICTIQAAGDHVELVALTRDGAHRESIGSLPPDSMYTTLRWSPDNQSAAFQRWYGNVFDQRFEVVTAGEHRQVVPHTQLAGFSWLPDGSGFVYSSAAGSTLPYPPIHNLRTIRADGEGDRQCTVGDVSYVDPDVHASGKLIATRVRSRSDVWRFPIAGTPKENVRRATRVTRQTGEVQTPSVSPDETEVVYLSDNGGHSNLWVAKTDGSALRQITFERDPDVSVGVPMWSPAGDWIAFIVIRGMVTGLRLVRPDGSGLRTFVERGWFACWSPDGRWLYYHTREATGRHEKMSVDGEGPIVVREGTGLSSSAVAPDGSTVYYAVPVSDPYGSWKIQAVGTEEGSARTLERIAGSRVPLTPLMLQPFLSPDGRWLAVLLMDGSTTNLWAVPTAGGPMRRLTDFGDRQILIARSVSWSAGSQHLYAAVAERETDIVLFDGLLA